MPALKVRDLYKSYGDLEVLSGISFDLEKGEVKAVLGPSGTGKSTLLQCINRLTVPDRGEVWLDGVEVIDSKREIYKIRSSIGMVFQHFNLFSHLRVLDNVCIGPIRVKKMSRKEAVKLGMEKLKQVNLEDKANAYPAELSGGQQQRAAIARAMAMNPKLMLFDEPTSALDPELIGEVLEIIKSLAKSRMTMLIVTHEIGFARSACDKIIFMEHGKILEEGSPDKILNDPECARTKEFLNKITEL